jgi:hypothetical protein
MYFLINAIDASLIDLTRECGVKQNREAKWKISEKKKAAEIDVSRQPPSGTRTASPVLLKKS